MADDGVSNENVAKVREFAAAEGFEVFVVCAQIEQEISELDDDEKAMFLEDLGLTESGKVISLLLNMLSRLVITFLPRSKHLLISWLQSQSAMILEFPPNKVSHCFHFDGRVFPAEGRPSAESS